jgi:hypothetical protein
VSYARDHPGYVAEAVVRNSLRMLHIGNPASERVGAQTLNLTPGQARWARFGFGAAAVLAVAGASTAAARRVPLWFWLSPLPFFAVAAVTAGLLRYRAPLDPFVLIAAAPAVAWLWDHLTRRGSAPAPEPELAPAR